MNLFILSQYKLIQQLYRSEDFMDTLINIDDFFDILNLYAFPNWLECEIVEVKFLKYFTSVTLKADYKKMPHPKGAVLLTKYDCQVKYRETVDVETKEVHSIKDTYIDKRTGDRKPKTEKKKCWAIDILIPNKHIINDNIYDLEAAQQKITGDQEESEDMENVVSNEGQNNNGEGELGNV